MHSARQRAEDFLSSRGVDPDRIDMGRQCDLFLRDMARGLAGEPSSLPMIPTFIGVAGHVPRERPVIVLDAGGTHFRVAVVRFDGQGAPVVSSFSKHPMPGLDREVGKEKFFSTIVSYMREVAGASPLVGFCFSYPTEMLPTRDGRLIRFVKQVRAPEVEGELIGENLARALRASGEGEKRVVVLNDTVATLLAGLSARWGRRFDGYIGFILGTGTNCCYIERNACITKRADLDPDRQQIINVESPDFDKVPAGELDRAFDRTTADPGRHILEKMVSGAYLGPLVLFAAREAAGEGLFSAGAAGALLEMERLDTEQVDRFLSFPLGGDHPLGAAVGRGGREDRVLLFHLVDRLLQRAALLSAVHLSAVVLRSGRGTDPCVPVCVTAEGSVFYGLKSLRQRMECALRRFLVREKERYPEIVQVENATLIGAAIAGLTN